MVVRAPALRAGDVVAVVSPSGPVSGDQLDAGMAVLRGWGLRPVEGHHARAVHGHLAGEDELRAADLNAALTDPHVRGVWIARGGYGLTRILDRLDWRALAGDPKVIVGFSDATALLVAAWQRIALITVHGQFVGRLRLQDPTSLDWLRRLVMAGPIPGPLPALPAEPALEPLAGGVAEAPLVGGNLTVLAALAGTPDQADVRGCVLLLEEVAEAPYRVDRALTQLRHAGLLDGVAGIALGEPVGCVPVPGQSSATFGEVVADRLGDLGVPVLTRLPLGHSDRQIAVAHGGRVRLDADHGELALLEPAVGARPPGRVSSARARRAPSSRRRDR